MFYAFIIFVLFIISTGQADVPQSQFELIEGCMDFTVVVESVTDKSKNFDLCGYALRSFLKHCIQIWEEVCFSVDYIVSRECRNHTVYSIDLNQRPVILTVDQLSYPFYYLLFGTYYKIVQFVKNNWYHLLRNKMPQEIVVLRNSPCPYFDDNHFNE
ncbi:hypothetical protein ACOME3_006092 [Neoechinorhynchus agilis]